MTMTTDRLLTTLGRLTAPADTTGSSTAPTTGVGINWEVRPVLPDALGRFNFWQTIAGVLVWAGYVLGFLVFLASIITWAAGGSIFGRHVSDEAKQKMLKVIVLALGLGSAGAIWSFLIA